MAAKNPDLTLIFDLPPVESLRRLGGTGKDPDKFERQDRKFFENVRAEYLSRAQNDPGRIRIVSSEPPLPEVKENVLVELRAFMARFKNDNKSSFKI